MAEEEAKKKAAEEKKEGEEGDAPAEEEEEKKEIKAEDVDSFSVEDVMDIGSGEPLFANFHFEDWALVSLRFELHILIHAFRHDLNDPDRQSFHEEHLPFYYNKYFKKPFNVKYFGVSKLSSLIDMVKDTVEIKNSTMESQLSEDTPYDNFVKLSEDHRRDRQRRIDAGDETASLKFQRPSAQPPRQPPQGANGQRAAAAPAGRVPPAGRGVGAYQVPAAYGAQKRPYVAAAGSAPSYSAPKQPRTFAPGAYGTGAYNVPPASRFGGSFGAGYSAYGR